MRLQWQRNWESTFLINSWRSFARQPSQILCRHGIKQTDSRVSMQIEHVLFSSRGADPSAFSADADAAVPRPQAPTPAPPQAAMLSGSSVVKLVLYLLQLLRASKQSLLRVGHMRQWLSVAGVCR